MKVLSVVGNRPQFVKSAPLSVALRDRGIDEVVLHTGQHYDPELSQVFFDELRLPKPKYALELHTPEPAPMRAGIRAAIRDEEPDLVLVYGDTNSTLAGALAANDSGVPQAHVEAGLRSGDLSMPEERNRIEVDRLAALLLCPDDRAAETLAGEGVAGRREVVGDVMADATRVFAPIARDRSRIRDRLEVRRRPYSVLTIHRAANTQPKRLRLIVSALNATGWTFVFPIHPRTRKILNEHGIRPAPELHPIEPVGYLDMLALLAGASRVVTDSGGLQKEAYWLGVPCITLRRSTEWVETVEVRANTLVDPDAHDQLDALGRTLTHAQFPANAPQLYGDGHASECIADLLVQVTGRSATLPT
jgi:UDP-N-acetylglucosamine 2-epimerase